MEDTRVAYGSTCTWWDDIHKVGKRGGIPCCPNCKGVLFEKNSLEEWFAGVDVFEAAGHPGYRKFVEWMQGKCMTSYRVAVRRYEEETGREVSL